MSFEQHLQQDWTPEVQQAWLNAYKAITALMLTGAREESSPTTVQDEKKATFRKPSELKVEPLNESKQLQPQADKEQKTHRRDKGGRPRRIEGVEDPAPRQLPTCRKPESD